MRYITPFLAFLFAACMLGAHPMPASIMLLNIKSDGVSAELQWPLKELQLALPDEDIEGHPETLIARKGQWLDDYLHKHMSITDSLGHVWTITINSKHIAQAEQNSTGQFRQLVFELWLQPAAGMTSRHLTMNYDAIMHQVVTHKMLVRIKQDWDAGMATTEHREDADLGVLMMNPGDNKVPPIIINLDDGSRWKGFRSMVMMGIEHISEGTDHLLFLIVLLLPSTLLIVDGRWGGFGGTTHSIIRLLKIVTAFTIGHSISLILGSLKIIVLPQQPVEIAIGITILITAIHAIRPVFAGREMIVAAVFGLVHGLAFSTVISGLELEPGRMAISILGFNIGIELMQVLVILCVIPWLIILSKNTAYAWFKAICAVLAIVAAIGWIVERATGKSNMIAAMVAKISSQGRWLLLGLVLIALISALFNHKNNKSATDSGH